MPLDAREFESLLHPVLDQLSLPLSAQQVRLLYQHYELLERWNPRINLTAIREPNEVVLRHFGESLALGKRIGAGSGAVVDIGSGAGFPGVPVAVCWPDRQVTLVESSGKKGVFLKEVARGLPNVSVFVGRVEDFDGQAEWAMIRGVSSGDVSGVARRLVRHVGLILSGEKAEQSANELGLARVERWEIPWDPRTAVVVGEIASST